MGCGSACSDNFVLSILPTWNQNIFFAFARENSPVQPLSPLSFLSSYSLVCIRITLGGGDAGLASQPQNSTSAMKAPARIPPAMTSILFPPLPSNGPSLTGRTCLLLFRIPHMPPAGSLKVLHAPARWGGIRRTSQTKIYNLETDEFVSYPPF